MLAVAVVGGAWRWYRESVGRGWLHMTTYKYLVLAAVATAACFGWQHETESQVAEGAFGVAVMVLVVLSFIVDRRRQRDRVEEKPHPANDT